MAGRVDQVDSVALPRERDQAKTQATWLFLLLLSSIRVIRVIRGFSLLPSHQAKWEKALLASAILMVFSRLVMASPSRRYAAISSSARRRNIGRPALPRAAPMIQRMDRLCWRVLLTCMGT